MLVGLRGSGNFLLKRGPTRNVKDHALQALFPLPGGLAPRGNFFGSSAAWDFLLFFSSPSGGQDKRGGGGLSGCTWCCVREASSTVARERASLSSTPSGAGEGEVARSQQTPPARAASSVASPHSSQHARRRDELREVSEDRSIARSSRAS